MINKYIVLAVIPARGGSKRVPKKNIKPLNGKPLILYSIEHAKKSKYIDRLIVSTDDSEIAQLALKNDGEVPFMRPDELASDSATDFQVFAHLIEWLKVNEKYIPDIIVQLRPTSPLRTVEQIDECIEILVANQEADSVRTVTTPEQSPYKMFTLNENFLTPLLPGKDENGVEYINMPAQKLPTVYKHIGNVDVFWRKTVTEKLSMTGNRITPLYVENGINGINTSTDWEYYEYLISKLK